MFNAILGLAIIAFGAFGVVALYWRLDPVETPSGLFVIGLLCLIAIMVLCARGSGGGPLCS